MRVNIVSFSQWEVNVYRNRVAVSQPLTGRNKIEGGIFFNRFTVHSGDYLITQPAHAYIYIYILRSLKFTLKYLKRSYVFRSHDHPQGAYIVPCKNYNLKHSVNYFFMFLMLWQHVVFLCVSRTLFRMSLVMVVRLMLCSVRLTHKNTTCCHSCTKVNITK